MVQIIKQFKIQQQKSWMKKLFPNEDFIYWRKKWLKSQPGLVKSWIKSQNNYV